MSLEDYQSAVAKELGRQLGCTHDEAMGECEGLEEMLADDLSPADAASEILLCMAENV